MAYFFGRLVPGAALHLAGAAVTTIALRTWARRRVEREWAAAWDEVVTDDADGEVERFCGTANVAEQGAAAEFEPGFVAAHALAESAGEDADFHHGCDWFGSRRFHQRIRTLGFWGRGCQ